MALGSAGCVVAAGGGKECIPLRRISRQGLLKQLLDALPTLGIHRLHLIAREPGQCTPSLIL